jgi:putative peptidoglycan lipid II flippase
MSSRLLKSTASVGGYTLVSRVLGFVRDVVIARMFGAGMGTDAFFVAFKIPNFLRRLFAEGAFSQAFVPVLSEYKTQRDHAELRALADHVAGTLGAILFVVTLTGVVAAPLLVMVFAPGFLADPGKYGLTVDMLRVTFPYLLFVSLTAFAGGILNTYGRFGVPAFTPVFLNLALIGAALWLAPRMAEPITALAWGVFIAGAVQLAFQVPFLAKLRLLPRPRWGWRHEGVRRVLRLMLPAIFGSSVAQINLLIDTLIASFLVTGSVSWLYYSDRLVEFPLGVFGIALATVLLPSLSKQHAQASPEGFRRTMDWGLRWVLVIGLPATVGLMLLAAPTLTTLFQYGSFTPHDVEMASRSLMAYSVGLTGFILVKVLAPGFYARQDTRTPVRIGVIAMVVNMVLNVALVFPLAHAGLALATSLAAFVNAGLLYRALYREGIYRPQPGWGRLLQRVVVASVVMGVVLWVGSGELAAWLEWRALERAARLLLWIAVAAFAYGACLWLLGLRMRHLTMRPVAEEPRPTG